jgi:hypothetical protein
MHQRLRSASQTMARVIAFWDPQTYNYRGRWPESSTAIQTVTSGLTNKFKIHDATLARALSLLLVTFIFYGTTVEAAHCHGRVRSTTSSTSSLIDPSLAKNLAGSKTSCSDCLICQLHQNFFSTLISVRPNANSLGVHTLSSASAPIVIRSQTNTPRTGRAPPIAN